MDNYKIELYTQLSDGFLYKNNFLGIRGIHWHFDNPDEKLIQQHGKKIALFKVRYKI